MNCLRCGARMRESEKSSVTGRTIREFTCPKCGFADQEEDGIAKWRAQQAREKQALDQQAREQEQARRPFWRRWLGRLFGR